LRIGVQVYLTFATGAKERMMSSIIAPRLTCKNAILASLPPSEIARLMPHLTPVELSLHETLLEPNEEITHAYFLEGGLASVVAEMSNGATVETGITGKEGMVGFSLLLGGNRMPTRTFIQIPGMGYKIKAKRLKEEFENSGALQRLTGSYIQAHMIQTAQTAACNRLHDIAERLARWLLACHDRMDSNNFPITHEFLSQMLGTPRSTVTLAAGILQNAGLMEYSRGKVHIRDRQGLEKAACECYKNIRKEFERLGFSFLSQ
jgi:CRP-like cAMP-binding protein